MSRIKKAPEYIVTHVEIELGEYGTDTYFLDEFEIEANYDYQPEEPMVRYYRDGSGYPGCPAQVEAIYDLVCLDEDEKKVKLFNKLIEDEKVLEYVEEKLEDAIWEDLKNNY